MDIQEAIVYFKREKLYWDTMIKYRNAKGEIPDNVTKIYNYFALAIQALKEKQEREKPNCNRAEWGGDKCLGFGRSENDDEPIDVCKNCEKYIGWGIE